MTGTNLLGLNWRFLSDNSDGSRIKRTPRRDFDSIFDAHKENLAGMGPARGRKAGEDEDKARDIDRLVKSRVTENRLFPTPRAVF